MLSWAAAQMKAGPFETLERGQLAMLTSSSDTSHHPEIKEPLQGLGLKVAEQRMEPR